MSRLADVGDGVDISLSWALTRPIRTDLPATTVTFPRSDTRALHEAATLLQSREPRFEERVEGVVTRLVRDESATHGRITIKAPVDSVLRSVGVDAGEDI